MRWQRFKSAALAVTPVLVLCALSLMVALKGQQPEPLRALDAKRPITYFIAQGNPQTGFRESDRQLAQWALQAWQRNSDNRFRFEAAPETTAVIRLYWAEPDGSEYGEMQPLVVGGRRAAAVYIRPDVQALG